jgi:hypothetical protein
LGGPHIAAPASEVGARSKSDVTEGRRTIVTHMQRPAGQVMPYRRIPLPLPSDIFVSPPLSFPDLAVWDEKQRLAGWNFGLRVPQDRANVLWQVAGTVNAES